MSTFEPSAVLALLKNTVVPSKRSQFELDWNVSVERRVKSWTQNRTTQYSSDAQLRWEANVVEYVGFVYSETKVHASKKKDTTPPPLRKEIPLLGPRFTPPSYFHLRKRQAVAEIKPTSSYLKPINVIHPFYYLELSRCPKCKSDDILWEGWTGTGAREVHGVYAEEMAIGYQLRCKYCEKESSGKFCIATTSPIFWELWEHWEIPRGIPHFFKRCATTRELFNLIIELRPSTTSGGLAEHIKQLHLLEYKQKFLEYLRYYKARGSTPLRPVALEPFSEPRDVKGYDDKSISGDIITELYLDFSEKTRKDESAEYMRTLTGIVVSIDNTFRAAKKGSVVDTNKTRTQPLKGGILSMLNEANEIIGWRFCQSQSPNEIQEILEGLKHRCDTLGVAYPDMIVADNCCHVRGAISKVLPETSVVLDVYHFLMRYLGAVINGVRNPYRAAVAKDITDAILKTHSIKGSIAQYWPQKEQELRLVAAFNKWSEKGTVWSAAALNVHREQLRHVQKGCLSRSRGDIRSDGSRIEGSHKGWNGLMRSFASGIVVMVALGSDFVLRRNIRVGMAGKDRVPAPFLLSTFGSHHLRLVNHIASLWNTCLSRTRKLNADLNPLPELTSVMSGELFGLVVSDAAATFGGLISMKDEDPEAENLDSDSFGLNVLELDDELLPEAIMHDLDMDIDPSLFNLPQSASSALIGPSLGPAAIIDVSSTPDLNAEIASNQALAAVAVDVDMDLGLDATTPLSPSFPTDITPVPNRTTITMNTVNQLSPAASAGGAKRKLDSSADSSMASSPKRISMSHMQSAQTSAKIDSSKTVLKASTSSQSTELRLHPLFARNPPKPSTSTSTMSSNGPLPSSMSYISTLAVSARLPLPSAAASNSPKLTRSQRLFSISTGIHVEALSIASGQEFYLFMQMRSEYQWASFNLSPRKWVQATKAYNIRITETKPGAIPKNPRALMEKLGEIEAVIVDRIARGDFISKQSQSDTFWKKHCYTVALTKPENEGKKRKPQTCVRCRTIMYPGPSGSAANHKRGFCSDGVQQTSKENETLPDWPQPTGIFEKGTDFHPMVFIKMVRKMYEEVVIRGQKADDLSMEYEAFAKLLAERTVLRKDGIVAFKLFNLSIPPSTIDDLIISEGGQRFLRLDCLRNDTD